jgi:transcriptional regulator with XRE-family HTH domain
MNREEFNRCVGEKINRVRYSREVSQRTLADLAGISQSMYSLLETGKRSITCYQLACIARVLKVPARDFLPDLKHDENNFNGATPGARDRA